MYIDPFKVFCDLVETSSFSKAAVLNKVSQSAVSQQIRTLENRLGCALMERGRRNVTLTPEGEVFHRTCKEILHAWNCLENQLRGLKNEVAGQLKVASIYSIGLHELPPRLKSFREKFPQVDVKVEYRRSPQVYEMVERGEADLGLVAFPAKRPNLIHEIFDEDQLVLICHPKHALAATKRVPLSALKNERFIAFEPDTPTRKMIDRHLRNGRVSVVHSAEFDNIETVKRAVEIESGISIVPANTVRQEVESGLLSVVEIDAPKMSRPLGFIVSKKRTCPVGLKQLMCVMKAGDPN